MPSILPVTYRLIDDRVVFVTLSGLPALGEGLRPVVAFQVDDIDPKTGAGWSVVVVGVAEQIDTDPPGGSPLTAGGASFQDRPGLLAGLSTEHISGRTFGPIDPGGTP